MFTPLWRVQTSSILIRGLALPDACNDTPKPTFPCSQRALPNQICAWPWDETKAKPTIIDVVSIQIKKFPTLVFWNTTMIFWCCYMLFTFYSFLSLLLFLQMFMLLNCGAKIVQTERLSSLCGAKIVQTERKSIKLACMFCWGAAYPRCFAANIQKFYGLHPIFHDVTKRTDHHNSKLASSTAILWNGLNFSTTCGKILNICI